MIACNEIIQTRDYLFQQFQSCEILEAEDMRLLVDFIYSINQCNSSLSFEEISLGTNTNSKPHYQLVNELPTFTILENKLAVFTVTNNDGVIYKYLSALPAGTYGTSNPVFTASSLILIFKDNLLASSIKTAFSPLNYSPSAPNVEEHLKGIDLKLADLIGGGDSIFMDWTGNGLIGVQDGSNTVFEVSEGSYLLDILVFLNGQLLWEDNGVTLTDAPNGIFTMTDAPLPTDEVLVYYRTISSSTGGLQSVQEGTNISVDNSDPANPVISTTGVSITDGDKGDMTVTDNGLTWNLNAGSVDGNHLSPGLQATIQEINTAVQPSDLTDYALLSSANFTGPISSTNMKSSADANSIVLRDANGRFSTTDHAYGLSWNGSGEVPTKNAIYDKIESLGLGGTVSWTNITDKPAEFPPSSHTHAFSSLLGIPSTFPPSSHTHVVAQIPDLNSHGDSRWLAINAVAVDSQKLDNIDSSSFLRSDVADQKTVGNLTFNNNIELQFGTGNVSHIFSNGTHTYWDLVNGDLIIRDNSTPRFTFERTTGDLYAKRFFETSDERIKENIEQISKSIYSYTLKEDKNKTKRYGTIAQIIEQTNPELVAGDDMKSVTYTNFLCLKIADLENSFEVLEKRMDKFENIV